MHEERPGEETVTASQEKPAARVGPVRQPATGWELAAWLRTNRVGPELARTRAEADADVAAERDSWA